MATIGGSNIVTDGLALSLDAANPRSYPGSGDTWYSLEGADRFAYIYGTPALTSIKGAQCFLLNDVGDRFVAYMGANQTTNNVTLEAWIHPSQTELIEGDRGCIIQGHVYLSWNKSNQKISNYWYSASPSGYHEPASEMSRENWHNLVSVWNSSTSQLYQYIDGVLINTVNTVATSGFYTSPLNIGWEGDGRQFAGGISTIKIYNSALSSSEVLQNYNAQKSRFGL